MTKRVTVVPYNEQWKTDFEKIRQHLLPAVREKIVGIEHNLGRIGIAQTLPAVSLLKRLHKCGNICTLVGETGHQRLNLLALNKRLVALNIYNNVAVDIQFAASIEAALGTILVIL